MAQSEMKRKLLANVIPAVLAPTARVAINHHYDKQIMDRRFNHEIELAERRAEMMNSAFGPSPLQKERETEDGLVIEEVPADRVYEGLRRLRDRTSCGFCHQAADRLIDADLDTASRGLTELRQYEQLIEKAKSGEVDSAEIEPAIAEMVQEKWDAVPRVMGQV